MDRFTLTIELGNDAMLTGQDIATALRKVAGQVAVQLEGEIKMADCAKIRDANGNTVGLWEVS